MTHMWLFFGLLANMKHKVNRWPGYTIAKNLARMKLRDRMKQGPFSDSGESALPADIPGLAIEDRIIMQAYLGELQEEEQIIVSLRAVSGWKHKDIARFLHMPVQHVIVKYNRSIKKLQKKFKQETGAV